MTRKEKPKRKSLYDDALSSTRKQLRKIIKRRSLSKVKAELWKVFSIYIRMRDCFQTTGSTEFGLCFTCQKRYHFKMLQAGHFVPGRKSGNLFSVKGTHAQCYNCNVNLKGNTLEYRRQIIKLYGEGVDLELEREAQYVKKYIIPELEELKRCCKVKIEELKQRNKIGG